MREIELGCTLQAPLDQVWDLLQRPATLAHVAWPLMSLRPLDPPAFPRRWEPRPYRVGLRLFGIIPLGWQVIGITFPGAFPGSHVLHDDGHGALIRAWDHRILVAGTNGETRYTDRLRIDAGWMTLLVAGFARVFFAHRQRRLRRLVRRAGAGP